MYLSILLVGKHLSRDFGQLDHLSKEQELEKEDE